MINQGAFLIRKKERMITLAKNDYFVIAYRILAYLYACLKSGEQVSLEYLTYNTDDFPIGKDYWHYIFRHLYEDGYIEGVSLFPILGSDFKGVKLSPWARITPKGIEYFQDNSTFQKAKSFLKELKEFIPGM